MNWIKADDRLPMDGSEFLTCNQNQGGVMTIIRWDKVHRRWMNKDKVELSMQATHWCPIGRPRIEGGGR